MLNPDAIRAFFRPTSPASLAEATVALQEARNDPQAAQDLLAAVSLLSVEDHGIAWLLGLFQDQTLVRSIQERCATDDAEALRCGEVLAGLMEQKELFRYDEEDYEGYDDD